MRNSEFLSIIFVIQSKRLAAPRRISTAERFPIRGKWLAEPIVALSISNNG